MKMPSAILQRFPLLLGRYNTFFIMRLSHKDSKLLYPQFCNERVNTTEYPEVGKLELPSNFKDLSNSEEIVFSKSTVRDTAGTYITARSETDKAESTEQSPEFNADVGLYASGSINLNSAMQSNVSYPFRAKSKPTHLNMPGGPWRQKTKYISDQLHRCHPFNSVIAAGFASSIFVRTRAEPYAEINNFPSNITQNRSYGTMKENVSENKNFEPLESDKLTRKQKLKVAIKQYGGTIVILHITISLASLGIFYALVQSGINLEEIVKEWGWSEGATTAGSVGPFVIAYTVHKILAPFRISLTLALTPFVVRFLRKRGFKLKGDK